MKKISALLFLVTFVAVPTMADQANILPACDWIANPNFPMKSLQTKLAQIKESYQTMISMKKPCTDTTNNLIAVCDPYFRKPGDKIADLQARFVSLSISAGKKCGDEHDAGNYIWKASAELAGQLTQMQDTSACGQQLTQLQSGIFTDSGEDPQDLMTRYQGVMNDTCAAMSSGPQLPAVYDQEPTIIR